jgi:hypothetical protein
MITLTVNDQPYTVDVESTMPLLWVLRDVLHLTGTKYGCGMAQCGACTVHLNGEAVRSCVTPVSRAANQKVITIEGGKALEKPVLTGRRGADWVEIKSGINVGQSVIVNPGNLQSGMVVAETGG